MAGSESKAVVVSSTSIREEASRAGDHVALEAVSAAVVTRTQLLHDLVDSLLHLHPVAVDSEEGSVVASAIVAIVAAAVVVSVVASVVEIAEATAVEEEA